MSVLVFSYTLGELLPNNGYFSFARIPFFVGRKRMLTRQKVSLWLGSRVYDSQDKRYRHRVVQEYPSRRDQILPELTKYIQKAHNDARYRLRRLAQNPLDPLGFTPSVDPAKGYPELLHIQTLKGYFGEIFAGLIAEFLSPFEIDGWKVPAYLFRFHLTEFQQLEYMRQTGQNAHKRPGRTGDDCLAFLMNSEGKIVRSLYCEAKCTADHDTAMIADAHEKVSQSVIVDIPQLVEVLRDSNDPDAAKWINALLELQFGKPHLAYERYDLVSYVCRAPKRSGMWLPSDKPHPKYTADRKLEAVEIHLPDVEKLIRLVYGKEEEEEKELAQATNYKKDVTDQ